ncbi:MAG: hypothetical protein A2908_04665 [Candidatus Staskawiczbacteria bacterium RIFCSPLOWO2_01_FULL_38_12b]|uniref:Uncharacterized protein n=1 Tax=Candidatus Staskawiczbacteria bacterium RIFCSPLOWO2_01_FULL_38_12b TaxID=1802214 RepID=A0A1G2IEI0_9BACT|nr:MAG: hypothetical protein A2908_04665 [Candidatus Staskawiczbacteria bacterium RIFCSPLOWO2_01_FULL_38_12b]
MTKKEEKERQKVLEAVKNGRETGLTPRHELLILLRLIKEDTGSYRGKQFPKLSDIQVLELIAKKRERLLKQLCFEESIPPKADQESPEKNYSDQPPTQHHDTGGGKRIMKKGSIYGG